MDNIGILVDRHIGILVDNIGILVDHIGILVEIVLQPLVNVYITNWKITIFSGTTRYLCGPCSIAM